MGELIGITDNDLDKLHRNNQAILGFLKAYESVDNDRTGIDPEQRITKNTMISNIKDFATENKNILSKYNTITSRAEESGASH